MSSGSVDFTGDCGECTKGYFKATSKAMMQPGQSATVNGGPPSNCMLANDGGKVFTIELRNNAGIYDYQVQVEAQGPSGAFSGNMHLAFQDDTNDVYYLKIFSSRKEWHTLSYNSPRPNIKAIFWSNYDFTVETGEAKAEKSDFQIISPAQKPA